MSSPPLLSRSMSKANGSQLSSQLQDGVVLVRRTYLRVGVRVSLRSGSGNANRISLFHAQSPPLIADLLGCMELVYVYECVSVHMEFEGHCCVERYPAH